ncbi:MAG: hypothetical protein WAU32_15715 [Thermoanaerobaculia bacterium]|jgi:hypothetical protein
MSDTETVDRCRNEACPRPTEPGEAYCEECGLEWSLFRRDGGRELDGIRTIRARAETER